MIKKILVPLDGSGYSKKALELACDLADKYEAELYLMHVILTGESKRTLVLGGASITVNSSREKIEEAGRKVMEAAEQIAADRGCKKVHSDVLVGPAAQAILEHAKGKNVDMIVMGSRGLSDISGLVVGSTSHKVSHLAECTCVMVH
ncbi:MAG: universal stress protein [Gammaproteobacteria bacterium]|nr:universal stress protein [Gammaproteobacteria bacterium]